MKDLRHYSDAFCNSASFAADLAQSQIAQEELKFWTHALSVEMERAGFPYRVPSARVFDDFGTRSVAVKERAFHFLGELSKSFEGARLHSAAFMTKRPVEIETATRFLWRLGAYMGDENFFDHVGDGDFIEIYGLDGVQLYRSWSCFEVCTYSLADLLTYSWDELYERPSWAVSEILSKIELVTVNPLKTFAYSVPRYVLQERFADAGNIIEFHGRKICGVLDAKTKQPFAFCSTATGRVIKMRSETPNLRFL